MALAQTAPRLVVVEIGGVGTNASPGWPWQAIEPYLAPDYTFRQFAYNPCGDIADNADRLGDYLESLRPDRAVLLGHSMGGVVALTSLGAYQLSDVVAGVVLVSAPVNGLSAERVRIAESLGFVPSPCLGVEQMEDASWPDVSASSVDHALADGIAVLDITNAYDMMVPLSAQQLPQDVNVEFDVSGGQFLVNHTAAFADPSALAAIANFIRSL